MGPCVTAVAAGPSSGGSPAARHGHRGDLSARVHQAVHMALHAVDAAAAPAAPPAGATGDARGPAPLQLAKVVGESAMLMRVVDFLGARDDTLRISHGS